jgi:hypothetical protein
MLAYKPERDVMSAYEKTTIWAFLLAGIVAFCVSLIFEARILNSCLQVGLLGWALAGTLEVIKVGTIILHRLLQTNSILVPSAVVIGNAAFKVIALVISILCSVALFAGKLHAPNAEKVFLAKEASINEGYESQRSALKSEFSTQSKSLETQQNKQFDSRKVQTDDYYKPKLEALDQLLLSEMGNTSSNGNFIGIRYKEFERRRALLESEYFNKLNTLKYDPVLERKKEMLSRELTSSLAALDETKQKSLKEARANSRNDDLARNEMMVAFVETVGVVTGTQIHYLVFAFSFALLISAALELAIILTFEYLTLQFCSQTEPSLKAAPSSIGVAPMPMQDSAV